MYRNDLVFVVTKDELVDHFTTRAIYHTDRAAAKEKVLPATREAAELIRTGADSVRNKGRYHADMSTEADHARTYCCQVSVFLTRGRRSRRAGGRGSIPWGGGIKEII